MPIELVAVNQWHHWHSWGMSAGWAKSRIHVHTRVDGQKSKSAPVFLTEPPPTFLLFPLSCFAILLAGWFVLHPWAPRGQELFIFVFRAPSIVLWMFAFTTQCTWGCWEELLFIRWHKYSGTLLKLSIDSWQHPYLWESRGGNNIFWTWSMCQEFCKGLDTYNLIL